MLRKSYSKTGRFCRVTFDVPPDSNAQAVSLCGDFNEWSATSHPMKKRKDGRFSITVSLQAGRTYQFKYLLDGSHWENDWSADGYIANPLGTDNSLLRL